jgi:ADP-dependent NAD(P)H-hydrate dehydratase
MPQNGQPETTPVSPRLLRSWSAGAQETGTVLVVGGARPNPGAVLLAGTAALRACAGTLQLAAVERHLSALGVAVPEAMVFGLPETVSGAVSRDAAQVLGEDLGRARSVVIGPGLIDPDETAALLAELLPKIPEDATVVLDAYAIGALSKEPGLAKPVAGRLLLTPNTTEAAFLLHCEEEDITDYVEVARDIAQRYDAVATLMGVTADREGRVWADESGHIGLATSGSGDTLAGLIGGFLARGAELAQAACWGSYVHAEAGQRLVPLRSLTGILARELLDQIPLVIAELNG